LTAFETAAGGGVPGGGDGGVAVGTDGGAALTAAGPDPEGPLFWACAVVAHAALSEAMRKGMIWHFIADLLEGMSPHAKNT
jgi:hypothetical protein